MAPLERFVTCTGLSGIRDNKNNSATRTLLFLKTIFFSFCLLLRRALVSLPQGVLRFYAVSCISSSDLRRGYYSPYFFVSEYASYYYAQAPLERIVPCTTLSRACLPAGRFTSKKIQNALSGDAFSFSGSESWTTLKPVIGRVVSSAYL